MHTKFLLSAALMVSASAFASSEHGGGNYHAVEIELGAGVEKHEERYMFSDIEGWYGNDNVKWVLKADLEKANAHSLEESYQFLYRHYLSEFWNWQTGLQFNRDEEHLTSAVFGLQGLAPYYFETDLNLLISEKGDISLQLEQENELLLTQKLFVLPHYELNVSAQDVEENEISKGITSLELGLKIEYEYVRAAAAFFAVDYERLLFKTADIAKNDHQRIESSSISMGLRFLF